MSETLIRGQIRKHYAIVMAKIILFLEDVSADKETLNNNGSWPYWGTLSHLI